jgi:mono/diheme cytochrome c family protein
VDAGGEVYVSAACVGCHQANGDGTASVPGLSEVLDVWPDFRDHMMWVRLGDEGWKTYSDTYGATEKPVNTGMPPHGSLSDQQLAEVVLYERVTFGEMEEEGEEYEALLAIAEGTTTFADAGLGELSTAAGVSEDELAAG